MMADERKCEICRFLISNCQVVCVDCEKRGYGKTQQVVINGERIKCALEQVRTER